MTTRIGGPAMRKGVMLGYLLGLLSAIPTLLQGCPQQSQVKVPNMTPKTANERWQYCEQELLACVQKCDMVVGVAGPSQ